MDVVDMLFALVIFISNRAKCTSNTEINLANISSTTVTSSNRSFF